MDKTDALDRLLRPRSVAVIGGGAWGRSVITALQSFGFDGQIRAVHPKATEVAGVRAWPRVADLPEAPDACFIGVNRRATLEVLRDLNARGAGGAVCFASGFSEVADGAALQAELVQAAGDMAVLGPNCYGMINALDHVALWPDVHGLAPVPRGVAILTQSSNIALNLTMQKRALPIAYIGSVGNGAQIGLARLGRAVLADPRVTALGLHVEGFGDLPALEGLAAEARALGKPIVVLKTGASEAAQAATVSHTASLAGSDAGATALLARLGLGRVTSLEGLLEALKLAHFIGPVPQGGIASLSCSGGEAGLMADAAAARGLPFAPLEERQRSRLQETLGPLVTIANPLDYHTFVWGDVPAMAAAFSAMLDGPAVLTCLVVDFPRLDRCDPSAWEALVEAAALARAATGRPLVLVSSLPETLDEAEAERLVALDLIPVAGLPALCEAIPALQVRAADAEPLWVPHSGDAALVHEDAAKNRLAGQGADVPQGVAFHRGAVPRDLPEGPLVLKTLGLAHKSEAGGVRLNLLSQDVPGAVDAMPGTRFYAEGMIINPVAELLIGVVADPAHGYVLTLGAGGVLAELWQDTQHLLLPVSRKDVANALRRLRIAPLLQGYRGAPPARTEAIVNAVMALQETVARARGRVQELEVNPLICTATRAVVADAVLREIPEAEAGRGP